MIIKYFILICICAISSYIGILKSRDFTYRVEELKKFQSSLNMIKSKIKYTHEPIKIIFKDVSKTVYNNKENIFKNVLEDENDFYLSWDNASNFRNLYFNGEDKAIIKTFGMQLRKNRC